MPSQQRRTGAEKHLSGSGGEEGQDLLRCIKHLHGKCPAMEVDHAGLASCSAALSCVAVGN